MPTPPPAEVLAEKADEINRLFREADIKDEYRPTHVAAFMLALWHSRGDLRRDPRPSGSRKLKGYDGLWRIRYGHYRAIHTEPDKDGIIDIVKVGHRRMVYNPH